MGQHLFMPITRPAAIAIHERMKLKMDGVGCQGKPPRQMALFKREKEAATAASCEVKSTENAC
jgi:hypothetical protein